MIPRDSWTDFWDRVSDSVRTVGEATAAEGSDGGICSGPPGSRDGCGFADQRRRSPCPIPTCIKKTWRIRSGYCSRSWTVFGKERANWTPALRKHRGPIGRRFNAGGVFVPAGIRGCLDCRSNVVLPDAFGNAGYKTAIVTIPRAIRGSSQKRLPSPPVTRRPGIRSASAI
jgi:hypothetical protein